MAGWKRGSQHDGVRPEYWRSDGWQQGSQGSQRSGRWQRQRNNQQSWQGQQSWQSQQEKPRRFWNRVNNGYSNYFADEENEYKTLTSRILEKFNKTKTKVRKATKRGVSRECKEVKYSNTLAFGEYQEATCKVVTKDDK